MEASEPTHPIPSATDQPASVPGMPGGPGGQASPRLTLGPVILPPEQGLAPTVFLKALPVPLYHTVPPGGLQPRAPLVTGSLEGASVPFILSPLLQPEGPSATQVGKPPTPALTVNIVGTLPVLSPGVGSALVSTGRVKTTGKYLCPHCGRDCLKPSVLEKHIRSHTGERPFPCPTCGIAFKTQSNLYKHRRTQTHLNNSRLSLESEGSGSSLLEEGDRPGETASVDSRGGEGAPERALSPGVHSTLAPKNRERKVESAPSLRATLSHREASVDQTQTMSPEFSLASPQPRRKLPDPKPCFLQRQQETCSEKPWDSKALEGQLKKCESTDSGYLSRSDSVEQTPVASSPLHSLSEHSAESEGEGGPGCSSSGNRAEQGTAGPSLEIEKKKLEERIAQLISHNQAVVDDPQLDHVRPRKTVLSKQGSIDLPMPYTYKDSFHFDIRALEPSRRRVALSPARSTFTPLEKARPLFFHSVPTQLSTTVECVPVTRSNSLPFVEGSKLWPEPRDPQDVVPGMQKALSPRLTPARLGCRPGLTLASIPSGHPRALVRQAAVEDLPCTLTGDPAAVAEDLDGKKTATKEGVVYKGRASKKCSQRKQRMFSQEKWQVYGNETFKRIYQKMKTNHQGGQKHREVKPGQGTELDLPPPQERVEGSKDAGLSQDTRIPILGDTTAGAKLGSWGSGPSLTDSLEAESPKQLKAVARVKSSPTLGSTDGLCLSGKSPLLSPSGKLDLGCQMPPVPGPCQGGDLEAPGTASPDSSGEVIKETNPGAQTVLRRSSGGSVALQLAEDKLPSERKRLKVEGLDHQEQPGPLEAETSGGSGQADPQPSQKPDSDSEELLGCSNKSILHVTPALEPSDVSSAVSAVALRWPGLGDKDSPLSSVPKTPGLHSLLPAQPQGPGVPNARSGGSFAPKYLLRLPQGENLSLLVAQGPGKGPDSLCISTQPVEQALLVGSELEMLRPPGVHSGPGEAGDSPEDPSWSRDRKEEAQMGREERDRPNDSISEAGCSPDTSTRTILETASILSTHTCGIHMAQDVVSKTHAIHCLCTDSPPTRARTYGNLLNPWTSSQMLGTPPKNALEDPPSKTKEGLPACFSSQAHYFLTTFTKPQGISLNQQKLALSHVLGTPRTCEDPSSFPSLKAEPQLTWCCLSRSLPLPAEQQRAAPGHLASSLPNRYLQGDSNKTLPKNSGGRTQTSQGGEGSTQAPELPYPTVPGLRAEDQVSRPRWKKELWRRRVKTSHENTKQKKLMLHYKRCEGSFWQRAKRLCKPPWLPRRSCLPHRQPQRTLVRSSAEVAGLNIQGEPSCASKNLSVAHGNKEKEGDCSQTSGPMSPGISSKTILETDKSTLKAVSPTAGEHDRSQEKEHADESGQSPQSNTYLAVFQEDLPQGKGLDVGPPGTQLPPSQDQISIVPNLCFSPDVPELPSSFRSKGTFPHHDVATSVATVCVSAGIRTGQKTRGAHGAESCAEETLARNSPDRKATPDSIPQVLLPGRPSPGKQSPGKSLEIPPSGPSSVSSHQEEATAQADFPLRGQYGFGDLTIQGAALGIESGACQAEGLINPKTVTDPSDQGQPSEVPEAPLRSIRKRSLEGMRKQTRVELSDTSSDDEDRLVIEI
ncbi:zinc finger protein 831 [Arvicanthis niloticus]|uniref:zinc finger protein 831 n=1 Tax=Arvicanthis niloticus TaxID=61156 RepID=UPI0014868A4B|nr:zinc finger protein 831 [Arvicanthis niloticus]